MNINKFTMDDLYLITRCKDGKSFIIKGINKIFTYPIRDKKSEYIKLMSDDEWKKTKELWRLNTDYVRKRIKKIKNIRC